MHICVGEIISSAHSKGGAGKTSLTFNLAYALAAAGARVPVVDLDTQMGQSSFLDRSGNSASDRDSGSDLMGWCIPDEAIRTEVYPNLDVMPVEELSVDEAIRTEAYPNLDVMPAEELSVNKAWSQLHTIDGRARLDTLIEHVRHRWDVTFLDTPGHQSLGLGAVLNASDGVLIPLDR